MGGGARFGEGTDRQVLDENSFKEERLMVTSENQNHSNEEMGERKRSKTRSGRKIM